MTRRDNEFDVTSRFRKMAVAVIVTNVIIYGALIAGVAIALKWVLS